MIGSIANSNATRFAAAAILQLKITTNIQIHQIHFVNFSSLTHQGAIALSVYQPANRLPIDI
jgi:hypothetical protein